MVQAGIAENAGSKHGRVCFCNTLMEAECLLKERACEVFILHHLQIFFTVVDGKTVVGREDLDRKNDSVGQSLPVIVDDGLLY